MLEEVCTSALATSACSLVALAVHVCCNQLHIACCPQPNPCKRAHPGKSLSPWKRPVQIHTEHVAVNPAATRAAVCVQLMDMLVEQTHDLRYEWRNNERPLRFTDTRVDEQSRGISLKSTPMSLILEGSNGKSFLMNMVDTPGDQAVAVLLPCARHGVEDEHTLCLPVAWMAVSCCLLHYAAAHSKSIKHCCCLLSGQGSQPHRYITIFVSTPFQLVQVSSTLVLEVFHRTSVILHVVVACLSVSGTCQCSTWSSVVCALPLLIGSIALHICLSACMWTLHLAS